MGEKERERTIEGHDNAVAEIIRENERRNAEINAPFNPITGENSILERRKSAYLTFLLSVNGCLSP